MHTLDLKAAIMNPTARLSIYSLTGLLLAAVVIAAVNLSLPALQAHTGTLILSVSDANPNLSNPTVTKIYLTLDQIMIHRMGNDTTNATGEWTTIPITPKTFELLSLRDLSGLASTKIPAGTYNQIRFRVVSASGLIDGQNQTLRVPSGILKVPELNITITDGGFTNVLIDIGYQSVDVNHNLMLRPVAHILS